MQEFHFKTAEIAENAEKRGKNIEIKRKKNEKYLLRIRKSNTNFHIKIRTTNFKIQKLIFKRGLLKTDKSKNVVEIDVEKDSSTIFSKFLFCYDFIF